MSAIEMTIHGDIVIANEVRALLDARAWGEWGVTDVEEEDMFLAEAEVKEGFDAIVNGLVELSRRHETEVWVQYLGNDRGVEFRLQGGRFDEPPVVYWSEGARLARELRPQHRGLVRRQDQDSGDHRQEGGGLMPKFYVTITGRTEEVADDLKGLKKMERIVLLVSATRVGTTFEVSWSCSSNFLFGGFTVLNGQYVEPPWTQTLADEMTGELTQKVYEQLEKVRAS